MIAEHFLGQLLGAVFRASETPGTGDPRDEQGKFPGNPSTATEEEAGGQRVSTVSDQCSAALRSLIRHPGNARGRAKPAKVSAGREPQ